MTETVVHVTGVAILVVWLHGVYAYVQMVRHRRPGANALAFNWSADLLTEKGLAYRRRVLWSWAVLAVLLGIAFVLGLPAGSAVAEVRPAPGIVDARADDDAGAARVDFAHMYDLPVRRRAEENPAAGGRVALDSAA